MAEHMLFGKKALLSALKSLMEEGRDSQAEGTFMYEGCRVEIVMGSLKAGLGGVMSSYGLLPGKKGLDYEPESWEQESERTNSVYFILENMVHSGILEHKDHKIYREVEEIFQEIGQRADLESVRQGIGNKQNEHTVMGDYSMRQYRHVIILRFVKEVSDVVLGVIEEMRGELDMPTRVESPEDQRAVGGSEIEQTK